MGLFDKMMSSVNDIASAVAGGGAAGLDASWMTDRRIELKPVEDLEALKASVNVADPGSVAAYYVYAVMALTADRDTGLSMMKYLFADLEPFGRGFTEGGTNGGWDNYMNDRLKADDYRWLPRAYFDGAVAGNGFHPAQPLSVSLHFNRPNTDALNSQSLEQLGRLIGCLAEQDSGVSFQGAIKFREVDFGSFEGLVEKFVLHHDHLDLALEALAAKLAGVIGIHTGNIYQVEMRILLEFLAEFNDDCIFYFLLHFTRLD